MTGISSTVALAKKATRKRIKSILHSLSITAINEQSRIVVDKLFNRPEFINAKRIAIYISTSHELQTHEIARRILMGADSSYTAEANTLTTKQCFIPRCFGPSDDAGSGGGIRMEMVKVNSWEEYCALPLNAYGIREPPLDRPMQEAYANYGSPVTADDGDDDDDDDDSGGGGGSGSGLDLIIMPGLAFDRHGNRLGYGRGYYDRYLARCMQLASLRGQPLMPATIALALNEQLLPEGEQLPHDPAFDIKPQLILTPKVDIIY